MKQKFESDSFIVKYNSATEMWNVYRNNLHVAVIYDDAGSIRFSDNQESFTVNELHELQQLTNSINRQYEKLNA